MSLYNRARRRRLRAFDTRPDTYVGPDPSWRWWNIHPLSDETDLLERVGQPPESCTSVDLFWRTEADVHFVHITAGATSPSLEYFVRERRLLEIAAQVPEPHIDRETVERVLATVFLLGIPGARARRNFPNGGQISAPGPVKVAQIYAEALQPADEDSADASEPDDAPEEGSVEAEA
ncbi:MAG: hypothetical protein AAFV53_12740 [Myxococcota bacterium]